MSREQWPTMANGTRNMALQLYLDKYQLSARDVALTARVPLATLWRAARGQSITTVHAAAIREALWRLSGEFYGGPIATSDEPIADVH